MFCEDRPGLRLWIENTICSDVHRAGSRSDMASRKLDLKAAPKFDIELERHLFDEWRLMWTSFEVVSGINDVKDVTERKSLRMHSLRTAVSKETLRVITHLPLQSTEKETQTKFSTH